MYRRVCLCYSQQRIIIFNCTFRSSHLPQDGIPLLKVREQVGHQPPSHLLLLQPVSQLQVRGTQAQQEPALGLLHLQYLGRREEGGGGLGGGEGRGREGGEGEKEGRGGGSFKN